MLLKDHPGDDGADHAVRLPGTRQFDLHAGGETYRILVAQPSGPAPDAGFPAIYLVDGHALFPVAAIAARMQAARPSVTGAGAAVVVGIGYPGGALFDAQRRNRDLLPVPGGAERFLAVIVERLMPRIAEMLPVDPARQSLVGHSYGGLFALWALFSGCASFGAYVAGSPSIWWHDKAILQDEARFRQTNAASGARLLMTVGGDEDPAAQIDAERAARMASARMLDNAREMAERLSASGKVACRFVQFAHENHVSSIPAMVSRAVSFTLAGTAPQGSAGT